MQLNSFLLSFIRQRLKFAFGMILSRLMWSMTIMKKSMVLCLLLLSSSLYSRAQPGDFQLERTNKDSFRLFQKVGANPELKGNGIKKIFIGKNYRKEWLDSFSVPVLNLKTDF